MMDFEQGRAVSDIAIQLTPEEATELAAYIHRLLHAPDVRAAHLSEVKGLSIWRELTIRIER